MSISVLIADESVFLRKIISELFSNQECIKIVYQAKDGIEAVEMVKKYHPDVLVLDLLIPKMDGLESFKLIMDKYPTPTIITSAISPRNRDTSILALLLGAFDYIIKPGEEGAKDLTRFKEELLYKVLLAAQSQIRRIIEEENLLDRKISLRQSIVSKTFEFGKYLKKVKHPQEIDENEHLFRKRASLRQSIVNDIFKIGKSLKELNRSQKIEVKEDVKPFEKEIELELISEEIEMERIDLINNKETITMPTESEIEQIPLITNELKEKITEEIEKEEIKPFKKEKLKRKETKLVKKESIEKSPKRREKVELKSVKGKFKKVKPINRKIKAKNLFKNSLEKSFPRKSSKVKQKKIEFIPDLIPIKGVSLSSNLIVIGASTGGPRTIATVLKDIPKDFPCPILVVQHLTPQFINPFVNTLNKVCEITIKIAENKEDLQNGIVYIAPGENHMEVSVKNNKPCIKIYKGTPVNFCMPSIDVLFFSAARVYKSRTIALLLTGMGEDGVNGLEVIQKFGGITISESPETAIVYGMPKHAVNRGVADIILPNYLINDKIKKIAKYRNLRNYF